MEVPSRPLSFYNTLLERRRPLPILTSPARSGPISWALQVSALDWLPSGFVDKSLSESVPL